MRGPLRGYIPRDRRRDGRRRIVEIQKNIIARRKLGLPRNF
jgi:hypothetical protein